MSADAVLQLPVRLHGIELGRPVDVFVDPAARRVVGFEVLCGDDQHRFLPWAAAHLRDGEIAVGSALMLLRDVDFYRARTDSFRALRGRTVEQAGAPVGSLRDLLVGVEGTVRELVADRDGMDVRLPVDATVRLLAPPSPSAA